MVVYRDGAKRARTADLLGAIQVSEAGTKPETPLKRLVYGDFVGLFEPESWIRTDNFRARGHERDVFIRARIVRADRRDACWIWIAGVDSHGYGYLAWKGQDYSAHRFAYEAYVAHPGSLSVDHLCAIRAFVNPAHLEATPTRAHGRRTRYRMRGLSGLEIAALESDS